MAMTLVNFKMDSALKDDMKSTCAELGMDMTTAFVIFAKKLTREKRIPFDVSVDPFYSKSNIEHLTNIISKIDNGESVLKHHNLIED